MNEKIRNHIIAYNQRKYGIKATELDERTFNETITEADFIYEEKIETRRHWTDVLRVCKIDGMLIGYDWAVGTGDMDLEDVGWEFDSDSICEVKPEEKTITVYRKID